jgi:uncharacterized protein
MARDAERRRVQIIGVISDTHGLVRDEARRALAGCELIIHAGDLGTPEVLEALASIAPVMAIRGNIDDWARTLPDTRVVEIERRRIYVLHDIKALDLDPHAAGFDAVISGHSHKPLVREHDGVLYLNPGSAGPRRFALPVSLARLEVSPRTLRPELVELRVPAGNALGRRRRRR